MSIRLLTCVASVNSFPASVWRVGGLGSVAAAGGGLCCRDCFKVFYVHKFRAVLGKNRLIFPGEKVEYGVTSMWGPQLGSPDPQALILCPCHPSPRWLSQLHPTNLSHCPAPWL